MTAYDRLSPNRNAFHDDWKFKRSSGGGSVFCSVEGKVSGATVEKKSDLWQRRSQLSTAAKQLAGGPFVPGPSGVLSGRRAAQTGPQTAAARRAQTAGERGAIPRPAALPGLVRPFQSSSVTSHRHYAQTTARTPAERGMVETDVRLWLVSGVDAGPSATFTPARQEPVSPIGIPDRTGPASRDNICVHPRSSAVPCLPSRATTLRPSGRAGGNGSVRMIVCHRAEVVLEWNRR